MCYLLKTNSILAKVFGAKESVNYLGLKNIMKNKIIIVWCIFFLTLLCFECEDAFSEIFYVAITGSDSNPGSAAKPFLTIQKAINSLKADSDEIWISPGDYNEALTVDDPKKSLIKIKGNGGNVNVIGGVSDITVLSINKADNWTIERINFSSAKCNRIIYVISSSNCKIQNCKISGGSTNSPVSDGLAFISSPNGIIKNNTIDAYCSVSINISNSEQLLVKGNDVSNAKAQIITFSKGCNNTTVEENYFHDKIAPGTNENTIIECRDNTGSTIRRNLIVETKKGAFGDAILVRGPYVVPQNITVENNTIINTTDSVEANSRAMSFSSNVINSICRNNIVYGCKVSIASVFGSTQLPQPGLTVDYNDFYGFVSKKIDDSMGLFNVGTNNITTDPLFTDTTTYKLSSSSPCIDTGDPSMTPPLGGGTRIDIGRYEYRDPSTVLNQGSIYLSSLWLNFGKVTFKTTQTLTTTISNTGEGDLRVQGFTLTGSNDFTLNSSTPAKPFTVAPNTSVDVKVDYTPSSLDIAKSGNLEITSDDANQPKVSVLLTGSGTVVVVPEIDVFPISLDFGKVFFGSTRTIEMTISNLGNKDLTVTGLTINGSSGFDINAVTHSTPFTVAPKASEKILVDFIPPSESDYSDTLEIASDDPNNAVVSVTLAGSGYTITAVDLAIADFQVVKRIWLKPLKPIEIKLMVKNNGTVDNTRNANIIGIQNGVEVYDQTVQVSAVVGSTDGKTYEFSTYTPNFVGNILWIATIKDDDTIFDQALATTTVYPGKIFLFIKITPEVTTVKSGNNINLKAIVNKKKKNIILGKWFVNDILGGNSAVGIINPKKNGKQATYTAPLTTPNPATVIIRVENKKKSSEYATAEITIQKK